MIAVNKLILNVDKLEESVQPWEADLSRELIDEALAGPPPTEFKADGASHLQAEVTKMGREVLVRGRGSVPLLGACKRCLKPLHLDASMEFTLTYLPADAERPGPKKSGAGHGRKKNDDEGPRASFDPALVDFEVYGGKEIDLRPALREQVLLALPPSPLCKEDCLGLCAMCGGDLNETRCGHSQKPVDPRWQALKNIQLDKKE